MKIIDSICYRINRIFRQRKVADTFVRVTSLPRSKWLEGRCAIITGGTSGIGYSIAEAFLNSGCSVIITGRDQARIDKTLSKLNSDNVFGFVMDNANVNSFGDSIDNILQQIHYRGIEHIDILVNNAGVNGNTMPYVDELEYDRIVDTNLKGVFFLSQIFGHYLVTNKIHGNILNIASASSLRPANSPYTVSKWGIRALTLGLAKALGKYGITVNGIAPGPTATPMMIKEGQSNMTLDRLPLGRYIMPEEIANMAVILVSDMGRSIMGDIVYMTGGAGILTFDDVNYEF
ncbi:MAG: SDR family oxidoreductase [Lachnospira sp.]|nr:SDR family oxidoreductase [Lachnospira sp.]